jgi:protein-S-isoprenylcysteine O-methyltransferase Ste14
MLAFRTVFWGTLFMLAALVVGPWLAQSFDASFPPMDFGAFRYAGIALGIIGIPLALYCAWVLFIPGSTRPAPSDAGGSFTIAGPYLFVRNPFMLGVLLTLWGEAIYMARLTMIVYAFVLMWVIYFWVIFFEEPALVESLGAEYKKYQKAVPRWFPQVRKYKG